MENDIVNFRKFLTDDYRKKFGEFCQESDIRFGQGNWDFKSEIVNDGFSTKVHWEAYPLKVNKPQYHVLTHRHTGQTGVFVKEYLPTGKPLTTQIRLPDGRIYFAPSFEFELVK